MHLRVLFFGVVLPSTSVALAAQEPPVAPQDTLVAQEIPSVGVQEPASAGAPSVPPVFEGGGGATGRQPHPDSVSSCEARWELPVDGIGSPSEDFARLLAVSAAAPLRSGLIRRSSSQREIEVCADRTQIPWGIRLNPREETKAVEWELLPFSSQSYLNSGYPNDRNNGALWAGRGISSVVEGGAAVRWGAFSAAFKPSLLYQQNRDFELLDVPVETYSRFSDPWWTGTIDRPQRFGDNSYWTFDPGQSYARVDAFRMALGVSTENLWWGPGIQNSITMSNTAPGFPHVFLGTSEPVNVGIGRLEAQAIWGRLSESEYFDSDPDNNQRFLAGFVGNFEPRWIPGLFLGIARVLNYNLSSDLDLRQYAAPLLQPLVGVPLIGYNPYRTETDQLTSLFGRWVLPRNGFEVYAEWAKDDPNRNLNDLSQEPDHGQAYTFGFQKVVPAGERRWVRLQGELIHLQERIVRRRERGTPVYYTHGQVKQGYTHRGQLLGAAVGPGSDSQHLSADLFTGRARLGLFAERVRRNEGVWYRLGMPIWGHDVELTGGIRHLFFWRGFDIHWELARSFRRNRNFMDLEGRYDGGSLFEDTEPNWAANLGAIWRPGW